MSLRLVLKSYAVGLEVFYSTSSRKKKKTSVASKRGKSATQSQAPIDKIQEAIVDDADSLATGIRDIVECTRQKIRDHTVRDGGTSHEIIDSQLHQMDLKVKQMVVKHKGEVTEKYLDLTDD